MEELVKALEELNTALAQMRAAIDIVKKEVFNDKEIYKVLKKTRGEAFISWLDRQDINYRDVDYISVEHKCWGDVITFTTLDDPNWFRTIKDIGGI